MKRKRLWLTFAIVIIHVLYFRAQAGAGTEDVVLQLKWKHQFQFAGYYAAIEKGYYHQAGLNVRLVEGGPGRDVIKEVSSGRAQYGVANSQVLLHRLQGRPLVVLAAIFQHSPLVFVTRENTGIKTPQDMVGRVVKMTRDSRDAELHAALQNEGVALERVKIVDDWVRKKDYFDPTYDVLSAYLTNEVFFYIQENIPYQIINPLVYGIDFYGDCLITSEAELSAHPKRVKSFREASLKGWQYAMAHPGEIVEIIRKKYPSEKSLEHLRYEAETMRQLILPELVEIGHMNPGRWEHIAQTFARFGWTKSDYSLDGFLYDPNPKVSLFQVRWIVGILLALALLTGAISIVTLVFNRRLGREMDERKRAEGALRESEERYRLLFQTSETLISVYDVRGTCLMMNDMVARLFGGSPEEFIGKTFTELHPEAKDHYTERIAEVINSEKSETYEDQVSFPEGDRWLLSNVHPVRDSEGRVYAAQILSQDITDRKRAEEALEFQALLLNQIQDHITATDLEGNIIYVNEAEVRSLKRSREEILGMPVAMYGDDPARGSTQHQIIDSTLNDGEWRGEVVNHSADGDEIIMDCRTQLIRDTSGKPVSIIGIATDITERRRAEEEKEILQDQLRQAQKLEAVGTLAGGIAHDFNNLLQAINGYIEILLLDKPEDDPEYPSLKAVEKASNRAADLVQQLLLFSRKADTKRRPIELNREVEQARGILERTIPKMIEIEVHMGSRLWHVNADPVQIEQILLNLGTNAADAMPDGGKLVIETGNVTLDKEYAHTHLEVEPGNFVLLTVSDTGHGMDKETAEKIFEPFYTTKEIGRGTGLGLASVYGIVKSHGGNITCYSQVGQGTTFRIYLPALDHTETGTERRLGVGSPQGGTETVLLVDDEEPIRDFASQLLKRFGYTVLTASSGEEALDIYSGNSKNIDLVLLDIGMPGMGGHKCLQEIVRLDPSAKVLIASGYSMNGQAHASSDAGAAGFVGKPYQLTDLLGSVRSVLDQEE